MASEGHPDNYRFGLTERRDAQRAKLHSLRDQRAMLPLHEWMSLPALLRIEIADHEAALGDLVLHEDHVDRASERLAAYEACLLEALATMGSGRRPRAPQHTPWDRFTLGMAITGTVVAVGWVSVIVIVVFFTG